MMKRNLLGTFLLGVLWTACAMAQLPESFGGWQSTSTSPVIEAQIEHYAPGNAAVVREYGFLHAEHRQYIKDSQELSVTLWQMKDLTGAIGLYSYFREPGTASLQSGYRVALWPDRLVAQRGAFLVDVRGARLAAADGKALMSRIPGIDNEEGAVPLLPAYLPENDLIPQSQKLITGPAAFQRFVEQLPLETLDFQLGAEAEIAEYQKGVHRLRFVMVNYLTPQIAARKLREFQQHPSIAQREAGQEIYVQRKGPLVSFVIGSPSPELASELLEGIQYEARITWNEHVPGRRDNVGNLVTNVFLLSGFVLLFALVAGLSFGGLRIFAKKFLPFPLFDRPSQMEIIRLHISDG